MSGRQDTAGAQGARSPVMEWVFGGIGLVLTVSLIGFIAWQAVQRPARQPAQIELRVEEVAALADGYVARIAARNLARHTAKGVEIEGTLATGAAEPETARLVFDYVPGGSTVKGALHFTTDPTAGELRLRSLGYADP